jgi:hypothetical protein
VCFARRVMALAEDRTVPFAGNSSAKARLKENAPHRRHGLDGNAHAEIARAFGIRRGCEETWFPVRFRFGPRPLA